MKLMEYKQARGWFGKRYALFLAVGLQSEDALEKELPKVKQALLDWKKRRGRHCRMVQFIISGAPAVQALAEQILRRIYHQESRVADILRSVEVQIALPGDGQTMRRYQLKAQT